MWYIAHAIGSQATRRRKEAALPIEQSRATSRPVSGIDPEDGNADRREVSATRWAAIG
jgi:hypothetical protein